MNLALDVYSADVLRVVGGIYGLRRGPSGFVGDVAYQAFYFPRADGAADSDVMPVVDLAITSGSRLALGGNTAVFIGDTDPSFWTKEAPRGGSEDLASLGVRDADRLFMYLLSQGF